MSQKFVYFITVNPWGLFFYLYLYLKKYKDGNKYQRIFIIPKHVQTLVDLAPELLERHIANNILFVDINQDILKQIKDFDLKEQSIIHFNAAEHISLAVIDQLKHKATIILTDEPTCVPYFKIIYSKDFGNRPFDYSAINEIWIAKGRKLYDKFCPIKELPIGADIQDTQFKDSFIAILKQVYNLNNINLSKNISSILFFDEWNRIDFPTIVYTYIYESLQKIPDIMVKQHPSDNIINKFKNTNFKIFPESVQKIPFEVIKIVYPEIFPAKMIYIAKYSSVLFNMTILFPNEDVNIIFLYKIYQHYRDSDSFSFMAYASKNFSDYTYFSPENFTEFYSILDSINGGKIIETPLQHLRNLYMEDEKELHCLRKLTFHYTSPEDILLLSKSRDVLSHEIDNRDTLIKELIKERSDLHLEIDNRDALIKELIKERSDLHLEIDNRDALIKELIKERSDLHLEIDNRDALIKGIELKITKPISLFKRGKNFVVRFLHFHRQ
jgi:hypothetical protein